MEWRGDVMAAASDNRYKEEEKKPSRSRILVMDHVRIVVSVVTTEVYQ